jgi:hypothetical protein
MEHRWNVNDVVSLAPYPPLEVLEQVEDGYIVGLFGGPDVFPEGQENRYHARAFRDPWLVDAMPSKARRRDSAPPQTPDEVLSFARSGAR